jgi:hypothetical protein
MAAILLCRAADPEHEGAAMTTAERLFGAAGALTFSG